MVSAVDRIRYPSRSSLVFQFGATGTRRSSPRTARAYASASHVFPLPLIPERITNPRACVARWKRRSVRWSMRSPSARIAAAIRREIGNELPSLGIGVASGLDAKRLAGSPRSGTRDGARIHWLGGTCTPGGRRSRGRTAHPPRSAKRRESSRARSAHPGSCTHPAHPPRVLPGVLSDLVRLEL